MVVSPPSLRARSPGHHSGANSINLFSPSFTLREIKLDVCQNKLDRLYQTIIFSQVRNSLVAMKAYPSGAPYNAPLYVKARSRVS